jgi:hypothetical protein
MEALTECRGIGKTTTPPITPFSFGTKAWGAVCVGASPFLSRGNFEKAGLTLYFASISC